MRRLAKGWPRNYGDREIRLILQGVLRGSQWILNPSRLPIPPRGRVSSAILGDCRLDSSQKATKLARLARRTGGKYDHGVTLDKFPELLRRRPFEPFRVVTSSGQTYDVRHPEMAWPIRNGFYVGLGGGRRLPEWAAFVSLLHLSAIESLPGNGARRRR